MVSNKSLVLLTLFVLLAAVAVVEAQWGYGPYWGYGGPGYYGGGPGFYGGGRPWGRGGWGGGWRGHHYRRHWG
ncbi:hypothetical protein AAVH_31736 [Aphelenchoides avenae]|nr:hypothetical protein AAVH_31736 [Aphelenchus avenae]